MNEVRTKTVRVFVGGGQSFMTAGPAYRKAAWKVLMQKHCYCDVEIIDGHGTETWQCRFHAGGGWYGMRVVHRLVRLWMRRDKVPAGTYRAACRYEADHWGGVELPSENERPQRKWHKLKFMEQVAALRELARRYPEEYKNLIAATNVEEVLAR